MRLDPVDRLDDLGLQRSQFDHQFLVVGFEMGDQVFVEDPEFRFHLAVLGTFGEKENCFISRK